MRRPLLPLLPLCGALGPFACMSSAPAPSLPVAASPTPAPTAAPDERASLAATRRQAVLTLLSDGRSAGALELSATDQGREFDEHLAEKLTPFVRITRVPRVRQELLSVTAPADRDVIRRIVRAHVNEVHFCYHEGLTRDESLAGRVMVDFQILETGKVGECVVKPPTFADEFVRECIAKAVKRWTFREPAEGPVQVSFAFDLDPG